MNATQIRIKKLRDLLLIHSCIYYHLNDSIVSDAVWQDWANELRILQEQNNSDIDYFDNEFKEWDGTTGHHLPVTSWVMHKANQLLRYRYDNKMDDLFYSNNSR